jgi:hypothetical protein
MVRIASTSLSSFNTLINNCQAFAPPLPTVHNRIAAIVARASDLVAVQTQVLDDALKTRIIVHQRIFGLIRDFINVKLEFGSAIERGLYENMTEREFLHRLVLKRPLSFMGSADETVARDGRRVPSAARKWRLVGTQHEEAPLLLQDYLSYDEMPISALIGISSPTYFINSGSRNNMARIGVKGEHTERGVYVGLVGSRHEIPDLMESRFLIASKLCSAEGGYGFYDPPSTHDQAILQTWAKFYDVKDPETGIFGFPIHVDLATPVLNIDLYKQRIGLTLETFLFECEGRGRDAEKRVHAFVVGLGLGVWQYSGQQSTAYLEALITIIERISWSYIEIVEVSWVVSTFHGTNDIVVNSSGGKPVNLRLTKGDPAARREDDRLLVACYAWDGIAFPGNEVWRGMLSGSGDPAAVCCSTVGELQNPYVNPFYENIYVVPVIKETQ